MDKKTKTIVFYSPLPQSGQTTLATYVGLELAKKNKFVMYVEMDRYSGSSPYLHKKINSYKKRLKNVLERPDLLKDNLEKSSHSENFFYLCQPVNSDLNELMSYNQNNIDIFLERAQGIFDYIIIDLPSSIIDPSTVRVFNKTFKIAIDYRVSVITEDIKSLKRFTNTNSMFMNVGQEGDYSHKTTIVMNKSHYKYSDFMENFFMTQPGIDICNVINVIDHPTLKYYLNEGELYNIGKSSISEEFLSGIDLLVDFIANDRVGIGINYKRKVSEIEKKLSKSKITKQKQEQEKIERENRERRNIFLNETQTQEVPKKKKGLFSGNKEKRKKEKPEKSKKSKIMKSRKRNSENIENKQILREEDNTKNFMNNNIENLLFNNDNEFELIPDNLEEKEMIKDTELIKNTELIDNSELIESIELIEDTEMNNKDNYNSELIEDSLNSDKIEFNNDNTVDIDEDLVEMSNEDKSEGLGNINKDKKLNQKAKNTLFGNKKLNKEKPSKEKKSLFRFGKKK